MVTRPKEKHRTQHIGWLRAALPLLTVIIVSLTTIIPFVIGTSLVSLAILGALAAYAGGAPVAAGS